MTGLVGRSWLLAWAIGLLGLLAVDARAEGQPLPDYTATAGMLQIGKDPERPDAEIFHVDYVLKGADPATRPVTFVFNGGPGGASIYLHLSAIGPMTIATAGDGSFPPVPARLEPNPDSWIGFTDMVFIDPVGTGYSRMLPDANGVPRDPKPYYAVEADVDSIAGFMRQWLTLNKRWSSPKAIAGESYGGRRVAALTRVLAEKYGINLNRAILISPALQVDVAMNSYSILYPMTLLPTQAAIAAHYKLNDLGTGPDAMKKIEDFALTDYLTGLVSLGRMSAAEQAAFYDRVAKLIGLDPALVARHQGRISEVIFVSSLLADKGQVLDRYDGTQASDNPVPEVQGLGVLDRTLTVLNGVLLPPFMDYVRTTLGYSTIRPYIPLDLEVNASWDSNSPLGTPDDVGIALAQNPDLKVLVVHGYQDLVTNYFLSRYVLEQSTRAADARRRLFFGNYQGGHMFYLRKDSRAEFAADVRGFFATPP